MKKVIIIDVKCLKKNKTIFSLKRGFRLADKEDIRKLRKLESAKYSLIFLKSMAEKTVVFRMIRGKLIKEKTISSLAKLLQFLRDLLLSQNVLSSSSWLITKNKKIAIFLKNQMKLNLIYKSAVSINNIIENIYLAETGKKVVSFTKLAKVLPKDKKIGFTNGCFDILHAGHVDYLRKAKSLVDILIVGLNSDESVRRIKGNFRPINTELWRAKVLAGLTFVDYIIIFEERTPLKVITKIKPHLYFKGGDWKGKPLPEAEVVNMWGGRVIFIDVVENVSTTKIIEKIQNLKKYI
ncbi:MAG: D-glycero-beta-D-manno-heptose 1-phosphate adenylyltransferase [Candidatus Anstonellales archaeon]